MATFSIQMKQRNDDTTGGYDILNPMSLDTLISNSNTGSSHAVVGECTTVAAAISALEAAIQGQVAGVASVNGKTGVVTLYGTDIKTTNASDAPTVTAAITTAQTRADAAYSLAEGKSRAYVYATVALTWTAITNSSVYSGYRTGDNIFIADRYVPDMWYVGTSIPSGSEAETTSVTSQTDLQDWLDETSQETIAVVMSGSTVLGYYAKLEGQKVETGVQSVTASGALSSSGTTAVSITHKTDDGYHHIPAGGENSQILQSGGNGTESWTDLSDITGIGSAMVWDTPRTFSITISNGTTTSSAVSNSVDGSANKSWALTLPDSGVTAGNWSAFTVNAKGIITAAAKTVQVSSATPTQLADGGIWFAIV